jgi:hypothetical protein
VAAVGVEMGIGDDAGVVFVVGVWVGVGVGVDVGVGVGVGVDFFITTPLFHTNFFPDLIQV